MIKERGILFSTMMVQSMDSKTETRRTSGLKEINLNPDFWRYYQAEVESSYHWFESLKHDGTPDENYTSIKCPYGKKGDLLWVRETWAKIGDRYLYKSNPEHQAMKWKPNLHMPKTAARIWLEIVDVQAERLHDITEEGAVSEGIERMPHVHWWRNYLNSPLPGTSSACESFYTLWVSINGAVSWKENPWVWVIKFKVVSRDGKPKEATV